MSSTDATTKIIGFEYQKLVALSKSLEAKDHTNIYLECYGDVSDETSSTEVKHSIDPSKTLYDTHKDFWKTLGNIAADPSAYSTYSKLIIHTTAKIKEDSIFDGWESLTADEKKVKVLAIVPNATIQPHFDKVKKCKIGELRKILERFIIEDKQESIENYYNNILEHTGIINAVNEEHREDLVKSLIGHITSILIKSSSYNYQWKINIDDFRDVLQSEIKKYLIDDFIFPTVKKHDVSDDVSDFNFIKKLKEINYDSMISFAASDYLRAQYSRIEMIKKRSNLSSELDIYDEGISETMNLIHVQHKDKIYEEGSDIILGKSKELYDDCINRVENMMSIEGVQGVRNYYPKGRVHFNVEENTNFSWSLKSEENEG